MTEMTAYAPGTPSWVDIGVSDIGAAVAFYSGLFGWETEDLGEQAGHYTMCRLRGKRRRRDRPGHEPRSPHLDDLHHRRQRGRDRGGDHRCGRDGGRAADGRDGGRADGRGHGSDRRILLDLAGGRLHRCRDRQRAGHPLLERAEHPRRGHRARVLRAGLRPEGAAQSRVQRAQARGSRRRRVHGDARAGPGRGTDALARVLRGCGSRRVARPTARSLGASVVVEPMAAGDIGRFSVLSDPIGAVFAVIQLNDPA